MTINKSKSKKRQYVPAINHIDYTTGQALKMARELNELSHVALFQLASGAEESGGGGVVIE